MPLPQVRVDYPEWFESEIDWARRYESDADRMGLAIAVARENAVRETGGPFGAAVFESGSGALVSVGANLVVPLRNSVLHAEIVAVMMAQARLDAYTLAAPGLPAHEIVTSCEPCAMCLGAVLWSGVRRLVYGAGRDDARAIGFDEGPVFPASYGYLEERGIEVVRGVRAREAREVLDLYARRGGPIYNA